MREPMIFVDMDGVIVDLVSGMLSIHDHSPEQIKKALAKWDNQLKGHFYIEEYLGITADEMWAEAEKYGAEWWENLPPYDGHKRFVNDLMKIGEVCILTAPTKDPNCVTGKMDWIRREFGDNFAKNNVLLGHSKFFCAKSGSYLIDDDAEKCKKFEDYGGEAILYARPWNSLPVYSTEVALQMGTIRELYFRTRINPKAIDRCQEEVNV